MDDGELTTLMGTTASVTLTTITAETEIATSPMPTTMMMSTFAETTVTTSRPPADSEERFAGSEIDSTETTTMLDDGTTTSLLVRALIKSPQIGRFFKTFFRLTYALIL